MVFTSQGEYITQFGSAGFEFGQFDEPVGLAVDAQGLVYVADTWNQRVQVLGPDGDLYLADPEGYRVLRFDAAGNFIQGWGQYSLDLDGFGLVSGVAVDEEGHVWVSDGANNRVMRYTLP